MYLTYLQKKNCKLFLFLSYLLLISEILHKFLVYGDLHRSQVINSETSEISLGSRWDITGTSLRWHWDIVEMSLRRRWDVTENTVVFGPPQRLIIARKPVLSTPSEQQSKGEKTKFLFSVVIQQVSEKIQERKLISYLKGFNRLPSYPEQDLTKHFWEPEHTFTTFRMAIFALFITKLVCINKTTITVRK